MWTYPDAEKLIIDHLTSVLTPVPVGTKAGPGTEFLKVFRVGGPRATPVSDRPLLAFEAYAGKGSRAWELADQARTEVFALAGTVLGTVSIKEVTEASGPGNLPDPIFPALTRYQFTLAVHLRGRQESSP
jgi:hypothetical protein